MPGSIDKAPRHDEATGWSGTAISYQRGEEDPPHHHVEGQLLFASRGVMLVETESNRWVIPPQRALWLQPAFTNRPTGYLFQQQPHSRMHELYEE